MRRVVLLSGVAMVAAAGGAGAALVAMPGTGSSAGVAAGRFDASTSAVKPSAAKQHHFAAWWRWPAPRRAGSQLFRLLERSEQVTFQVRTAHGFVTFQADRGLVKTVSAGSLDVQLASGSVVTVPFGPATHFRGTKRDAIHQGERAVVVLRQGVAALVITHPVRADASSNGRGGAATSASGSVSVS